MAEGAGTLEGSTVEGKLQDDHHSLAAMGRATMHPRLSAAPLSSFF